MHRLPDGEQELKIKQPITRLWFTFPLRTYASLLQGTRVKGERVPRLRGGLPFGDALAIRRPSREVTELEKRIRILEENNRAILEAKAALEQELAETKEKLKEEIGKVRCEFNRGDRAIIEALRKHGLVTTLERENCDRSR